MTLKALVLMGTTLVTNPVLANETITPEMITPSDPHFMRYTEQYPDGPQTGDEWTANEATCQAEMKRYLEWHETHKSRKVLQVECLPVAEDIFDLETPGLDGSAGDNEQDGY